jgi:hypothetical protein
MPQITALKFLGYPKTKNNTQFFVGVLKLGTPFSLTQNYNPKILLGSPKMFLGSPKIFLGFPKTQKIALKF